MRWAVVYRKGRTSEVWAEIQYAPESSAAVMEALTAWSRWPAWQRRIAPGGTVTVVPERRFSASVREQLDAPLIRHDVLSWDQLAPQVRRVSFPVSSSEWAAFREAAAAADQSLSAWCSEQLRAAAGVA